MKNIINYYYNLYFDELRKKGDIYIFKIKNYEYKAIPFYGSIKSLKDVCGLLTQSNKYYHKILVNKDKNIITMYENKQYVIIQLLINNKNKLEFIDIIDFQKKYIYDKVRWKELWQNKIDYYEYQASQIGVKYKLINQTFNYYVGLTECAIQLLEFIKDNYSVICTISHNRINFNDNVSDYHNPLNMIIDSRTRDIAEYVKMRFFEGDIIDSVKIAQDMGFGSEEVIIYFSRLLYPSYYFDLYDQVIKSKVNEEVIKKYIKKNLKFEIYLRQTYLGLKSKFYLPNIEWLN